MTMTVVAAPDGLISCAHCGRGVPPQRPWQTFCSHRCRQAALRGRQALAVQETADPTGAAKINAVRPSPIQEMPVKPHFQNASRRGVRAPSYVVEAEVFGSRVWRQAVSPDGVVCQVGTLRPRALQNGGAS
jgi:endogenous inhibitor of DNA gyrase (YacG/DUF329 family)